MTSGLFDFKIKILSSLEKIYEDQVAEATSQNQTLLLRNYFRWKFFDIVLSGLKNFLNDGHNNIEKGKSIREITKNLNSKTREISENEFQNSIAAAIVATREFAESILRDDVRSKIQNAIDGSPRGRGFDVEKFLQNISKNAVENLMRNFEIEMRDESKKFAGAGYSRSRGLGSRTSRSMKLKWDGPEFRENQIAAIQSSWDGNSSRLVAASYRAAEQIHENPGKFSEKRS